ncbi:MAG: hypothetical protein K6U80_16110, partial [Firmicutes bacterium]|nr:hypothetical protein [Bacillota bacterium]
HFYSHSFRYAQGTKRNETVAFELFLFYNSIVERTGNYKSRGVECATLLEQTAFLYVVDCPFKHK